MAQRIFGNRIAPACRYCELSLKQMHDDMALCERKGVVRGSYSCRHYIYDPVKREPKKRPDLNIFDHSDFSL